MNSHLIGYHGCDIEVAYGVVNRKQKLTPGDARYDWLGTGVYFWEEDPHLAWVWARHLARNRPDLIKTPAVIGAVIEPTDCLNLVHTGAAKVLVNAYEFLLHEVTGAGGIMPQNASSEQRFLDHAVFETLHKLRVRHGLPSLKSIRAIFQSGDPVFPGSGIRKWDHVQVCVRDDSVIRGCFFVPA